MSKGFATGLGIAFLIAAVIGFVAPSAMGFHPGLTLTLVHLISGALSLYFGLAGTESAARTFNLVFGASWAVLGFAGFLAGTPGVTSMQPGGADDYLLRVIPGLLEIGTVDHLFHIVLGTLYAAGGALGLAPVRGRVMSS